MPPPRLPAPPSPPSPSSSASTNPPCSTISGQILSLHSRATPPHRTPIPLPPHLPAILGILLPFSQSRPTLHSPHHHSVRSNASLSSLDAISPSLPLRNAPSRKRESSVTFRDNDHRLPWAKFPFPIHLPLPNLTSESGYPSRVRLSPSAVQVHSSPPTITFFFPSSGISAHRPTPDLILQSTPPFRSRPEFPRRSLLFSSPDFSPSPTPYNFVAIPESQFCLHNADSPPVGTFP